MYLLDEPHRLLWVPVSRCASSSLKYAGAGGQPITQDEAVAYSYLSEWVTIASVRHPCDRFVSAMWSVMGTRTVDDVLSEWPLDRHIAPLWSWFAGLNITRFIRFERLASDWDELRSDYPHLDALPHRQRGLSRPVGWRDAYDWEKISPLYRPDFERFGYAYYV